MRSHDSWALINTYGLCNQKTRELSDLVHYRIRGRRNLLRPLFLFYCIVHQFGYSIFSDWRNWYMWYGAIRVGTVEYGIIGKVEQDGLHLSPNHTLYQIARLSNCSSGSGKMDSTQVEPFANIVHGPLMTWGSVFVR